MQASSKAKAEAKKAAKATAKSGGGKKAASQLTINPNNLTQSENDYMKWHFEDIDELKREAMFINSKTLRQHLRAGFDLVVANGKKKVDVTWLIGLHKTFSEAEMGGEPSEAVELSVPVINTDAKLDFKSASASNSCTSKS